ncbi:OsmC family protein [Longispora albida]|uniref:OsmC family protein n=1 Tax=Longispora albida TaxID=203523 RepID=UPI00058EBD49|nr:OsmC family protein [Longispora albida]
MAIVNIERTEDGFVATNGRGGQISIGGPESDFTPVELLLAALGGCEIVTVEPLTAQRGHRLVKLAVTVSAEKIRPNKLGPITATYDVVLPEGDDGEVFRSVAHRVHDRHCTVGTALREETETIQVLPEA